MPRQAPTLMSRNGIERRNAVEAQSPIKPNMRSQQRSRVGDNRIHLGRLGHRQQGNRVGAVGECRLNLSASLRRQIQQSVRCPGTVVGTHEGRFVVGSRALRTR